MLELRLVVPEARAAAVLALLEREAGVTNVVHVAGAALEPRGDLVACDVAREDASLVVAELRALGLERDGSIALSEIDVSLSEAADRAVEAAAGSPADAVVWEEVAARTSAEAELSVSFLVFMALAALMAGAGILTDSVILIIGAMVLGPEFGPIAGFCVAAVQRRRDLARRSAAALAVGFPLAMAAAAAGALLALAAGIAPDELNANRRETLFVSHPSAWSAIVAVLAGVAGVLSLTAVRSGALVGVLISVTTIPATANVGLATAYRDFGEWWGSLLQLTINVLALLAAGVGTLALQRAAYARRRRRHRPA